MDKRPYQVVADHIVNRDYYGSGDSILTETMWHQFGVHPTDPGLTNVLQLCMHVLCFRHTAFQGPARNCVDSPS